MTSSMLVVLLGIDIVSDRSERWLFALRAELLDDGDKIIKSSSIARYRKALPHIIRGTHVLQFQFHRIIITDLRGEMEVDF